MTFLVPKNMSKVTPLSPPATEEELAWWKGIRSPIGWRQGLIQAVPFLVIWTIIDWIRGRIGFHSFVVIPLLAGLMGLVFWAFTEKHHRNQHIRWKRMRDELGVTTEDLPSTTPDAKLFG